MSQQVKTAEWKAAQSARMKAWHANRKAKKEAPVIVEENGDTVKCPNFEQLYRDEYAKNIQLENKCAEYEKLCKAYAERETQMQNKLQRSTLDYNAKTKHMLDCVKHAYISMQLAVESSKEV